MIGVSFQPGAQGNNGQQKPQGGNGTGGGVQEAIKVLSLRLPRVVGAQAVSPQALLSSPGSNGSRIDSIVNQVLAKYFPGAAPNQTQGVGMQPAFDPFQGAQQPQYGASIPYESPFRGASPIDTVPKASPFPRIVADLPPMAPPEAPLTGGAPRRNQATMDGGNAFPAPLIGTLPKRSPFPDMPAFDPGYPQPYEESRL